MKKLLGLLTLLCAFSLRADTTVAVATAAAATAISTTPLTVTDMTITATTTNITTVKFFDSASLTTYVQAAHVTYASYATNYDVVWTNENNVLLTNSFSGVYTAPTSVSVATNTIPTLYTVVVPGSGSRTKVIRLQTMKGLVAVANYGAIIEVDYLK